MTVSIQNALAQAKNILNQKNIADFEKDSELLLEYCLKTDRAGILLNRNNNLSNEKLNKYMELINYRAEGKPLQYITGEQEFMGLSFIVNENTLIPRRETEELVEIALDIIKEPMLIMDIGTGSGCIPISIASLNENVECIGVDYSKKALEVAKKNGIKNNVSKRIKWIYSDLFNNISMEYYNAIDVIISNPPYIKSDIVDSLMKEVKDYEPRIALDGGKDGLDFYRKIIIQAKKFLKQGGYICFEIGHDQKKEVEELLVENQYYNIRCKKDLSGFDRMIVAQN